MKPILETLRGQLWRQETISKTEACLKMMTIEEVIEVASETLGEEAADEIIQAVGRLAIGFHRAQGVELDLDK